MVRTPCLSPNTFHRSLKMKTSRNPFIFLVTGLLLLSSFESTLCVEEPGQSGGKYAYTTDWFTKHIPTWTHVLSELKGKPDLNYLEVGVWEGRSFFWVLDNILTHPSSKAIALDVFFGDEEQRFRQNLERSGHASRVRVIKGFSQQKLRDLELNTMDLIYIDGDHKSKAVLTDALLSWDLLKEGGILIFDDYRYPPDLPIELRPEYAIDVFVRLFGDELKILHSGYQFIVRKTKTPCNPDMGFIERWEAPIACSTVGPYVYYWKPRKLYEARTNREIPLEKGEEALMENTLLHLRMAFRLEVGKKEAARYRKFLDRLGLQEISVSAGEGMQTKQQ